jgi:hypothetical protein
LEREPGRGDGEGGGHYDGRDEFLKHHFSYADVVVPSGLPKAMVVLLPPKVPKKT